MSDRLRVLKLLDDIQPRAYCDDCIAAELDIKPRQTVNLICRKLNSAQSIGRATDRCDQCGKSKITNSLKTGMQAAGHLVDVPTRDKKRDVSGQKPALRVEDLVTAGFERYGQWQLSNDGVLTMDAQLPKDEGVYAFAIDGVAVYVGVATMGLAKRIYFYKKPGATQPTSIRINQMILGELRKAIVVEIYAATPKHLEWNGLPVHGSAGLELGLIKKYALPWNKRSAG